MAAPKTQEVFTPRVITRAERLEARGTRLDASQSFTALIAAMQSGAVKYDSATGVLTSSQKGNVVLAAVGDGSSPVCRNGSLMATAALADGTLKDGNAIFISVYDKDGTILI